MKVALLLLLQALCFATDLAYREWFARGLASIDLPLLFVLWLALEARRWEMHVVILFTALARTLFGLDGWPGAWLPLILGGESMFLLREHLILRWLIRRAIAAGLASALALAAYGAFLETASVRAAFTDALRGALLASLSVLGFFPILDAVQPLLRPNRPRTAA